MITEVFQLLEDQKMDNSIKQSDIVKVCHKPGAKIHDENSNIKFFFGENLNYIQVGTGFLEFDTRILKI